MIEKGARFIGGAILLLLCCSDLLAADRPLGTVFYSPEERAALVAARHADTTNTGQGQGASNDKDREESPKSLPYAVSGIVKRGGGKSVVWLNGQPVAETKLNASLPSFHLSSDHVVIDGKAVKVGETLDAVSGKRLSPLPVGAVKVKP